MEKIAQHFVITFYELPAGGLDTLMQAAVRALGLQERYSLAYACSFLVRTLLPGMIVSAHVIHIEHFRDVHGEEG
jgi:hypothetical protein